MELSWGVSDDERCQAGVPQDILFKAQSQVQICTWALSLQRVDGVTSPTDAHVPGSPGPPPSARLCQAPDMLCSPSLPDPSSLMRSRCGLSVCSLTTHTLNSYPQPEVMCGWASGGGLTHQLRGICVLVEEGPTEPYPSVS